MNINTVGSARELVVVYRFDFQLPPDRVFKREHKPVTRFL